MNPTTAKKLVELIEQEKQRLLATQNQRVSNVYIQNEYVGSETGQNGCVENAAGTEVFLFTRQLEKACLSKGISIRDLANEGFLFLDLAFSGNPSRWNGKGEKFTHPDFYISFKGYSGPLGLFNTTKNDKTRGLFYIQSMNDGASLESLRHTSYKLDPEGDVANNDDVFINYGRIKQIASEFKAGGKEVS